MFKGFNRKCLPQQLVYIDNTLERWVENTWFSNKNEFEWLIKWYPKLLITLNYLKIFEYLEN